MADMELGRPTFQVTLEGAAGALAGSASVAAVLVDRYAFVVHLHGGRVLHRLRLNARGHSVAVSHDGAWVAAADEEGGLRVFRAASGRRIHQWAAAGVTAVAFTGDDRHLLVGGPDGVRRIELTDGATMVQTGPAIDVIRLRAAPGDADAEVLALDGKGTAWVARSEAWAVIATGVVDADISAEGVVASIQGTGHDKALQVGPSHQDAPSAPSLVRWHPDVAHLALALEDGSVGLLAVGASTS